MQREYLIETRSVADEKGNLLNLRYYLIEEEPPQSGAPLYRLCIRKSPAGNPDIQESESTSPVSSSESCARRMLCRLIRNAVTPVCLLEIVDDMLTCAEGQIS